MTSVQCEECNCVVDEDDISECPSDSLNCPMLAHQCDDLYLPLDFEKDGTDAVRERCPNYEEIE